MFKDLRDAGWFPWPKILGMRHEADRLMPLLRSSPGAKVNSDGPNPTLSWTRPLDD